MSGHKIGLVGQISKKLDCPHPMFIHCVIHQQALCGKYVDISCVLKPVTTIVNSIRAHALEHRQFCEFLKDIDSEHTDLPYYTHVRWLSCGKVLAKVFFLRKEIDIFLKEKDKSQEVLSDINWLWKLAFVADLTEHMNISNLKMQGESNLLCQLYSHIKGFRGKLALFKRNIADQNFVHFPKCQIHQKECRGVPFPGEFAGDILSALLHKFDTSFEELDENANTIRLFENPFACDVEEVPAEYQ